MLYPKKQEVSLKEDLFRNPTKEYRGTPFWAWNTKITKEHIKNTLDELKEMGMGGAHIHSRTGMNIPYLSEEFLTLVRYAHDYAEEKDMLTWLYDEDRWPSGAAGGLVTKDPKYRIRYLVFSPTELTEGEVSEDCSLASSAKAVRSNNRTFLAKYEVQLSKGYIQEYHRLEKNQKVRQSYDTWFAYLEISGDNAWFNNQAYLNTLDKTAVERFVEVTHEAYCRMLGDHFGSSIPAIFTDEPQFSPKTMFCFAEDRVTLTIPYTDDFEDTYAETYKDSFLDHLPEIFWDLPGLMISPHRYRYHDHICERFTRAFADTVGQWCQRHNLLLAGHMMQEPTLYSQTSALGEAMRSYRSFGIPGIDMLCDRRELTTAKQAQSAAHQYDCPGVLSELYGVTNWDFDFRGHKLAGDWQAALGITVRVHHLTWTSMAGEAKRDYPAPIGYQSPWYKEYRLLENYFARINTVLTRGKVRVRIGVIHPIESYWLYFGTREHTEGIRKEMDRSFEQLVQWLLYGLIDFDFIAESLLPQLTPEEITSGESLPVGAMAYEAILVPNCVTLRRTTLERLKAFAGRGGKVIFAGKTPSYIDAIASKEVLEFVKQVPQISFCESDILDSLSMYREIDIRDESGIRTDHLLYQLRSDGNDQWLFLSHSRKPVNADQPLRQTITISIRGLYKPVQYHPLTGEITSCRYTYKEGKTILKEVVYDHDSLLYKLCLTDKEEDAEEVDSVCVKELENCAAPIQRGVEHKVPFPSKVPVTLSEPNVLILDMAEYRVDQGAWQEQEELLRIDNVCRKMFGYPMRTEAYAQPWLTSNKPVAEHTLALRFHIHTVCKVCAPALALEEAEAAKIRLNGTEVPVQLTGWYTDRDIQTIVLPDLELGENILEIFLPYHSKKDVEYAYLLGDFSVWVEGRNTLLREPVRELAFGDICMQGLPFYGGNITYELPIHTTTGRLTLGIPQFRCPLIKAGLNSKVEGYIAFAPYTLDLGEVSEGDQRVFITAFGNRVNTFGPIHNCNYTEHWIGPNAWRTEGSAWAYEYQLKKSGILVSPVLSLSSR